MRYRGARSPKKPFRPFVRASFSSKNKRGTGLPPLDPPMLFKTGTSGTGTMCPSQRDVLLIESQIKGVKKGMDQFQVSVLQRYFRYERVDCTTKKKQKTRIWSLNVSLKEYTINNQRLWSADDNDRKSKRSCSNVTCGHVFFFPFCFKKRNA